MKDLHVPWNPQTIDTTAAITPAQACQLLSDYPQIQSLPPVYLEREGIEGLRGHSVRSATFYPRYLRFVNMMDDKNDQASEASIGPVEEREADDCREESSEDIVGGSKAKYCRKLDSNQSRSLQVDELEVVLVLCNYLELETDLKFMTTFLNCDIVEQLRFHIPDPIKDILYLDTLLESRLVKNISRLFLSVVPDEHHTHGRVIGRANTTITTAPGCTIVLPSLKSLHLEVLPKPEDVDFELSCRFLQSFPNLQQLSTPWVGFVVYSVPVDKRSAFKKSLPKSLGLIASSGTRRLRLCYRECGENSDDILGLIQEHLFACKTIDELEFNYSKRLSVDHLVPFIRAWPQLRKLELCRCGSIDDALFSAIQNLRCLVVLNICGTRCSYDGTREFIKWRYQQLKELNVDMKPLNLRLSCSIDENTLEDLTEQAMAAPEVMEGARVSIDVCD